MNKFVTGCLIFAAGVVTGAVPAAFYFQNKYFTQYDNDVKEMRAFYLEKMRSIKTRNEPEKYSDISNNDPTIEKAMEKAKENLSDVQTIEQLDAQMAKLAQDAVERAREYDPYAVDYAGLGHDNKPIKNERAVESFSTAYPIPDEEAGAMEDYKLIYLTYDLGSEELTDNKDYVIDADYTLGPSWREVFSTYSEGATFHWRNDRLMNDYEITIVNNFE